MKHRDDWLAQVARALIFLALVVAGGAAGFYSIWLSYTPNPSEHGVLDALYLAVITLTTVGYGDNMGLLLLPEPGKTLGEVFSIVYTLVAYGTVVWTSSLIIAYVVAGSMADTLFRRRQKRRISMMNDHFILCGVGRTGVEIAAEFVKTAQRLVVIDADKTQLEMIGDTNEHLAILEGDPTDEQTLETAGIARARGLMANLPSDPENLFLTITAKSLKPDIRLVASAIDVRTRDKLVRAGADSVVFPWQIGAMRIASEMIRPTVVSFLDRMLRDPNRQMRVSEIDIPDGSRLSGATIHSSGIHKKTGLLVVALRENGAGRDQFDYNPDGGRLIREGQTLVVIGEKEQVESLRELVKA